MKIYIGVTDNDWYSFLRERPELDEVNFWQPGGARLFQALQPGEPFLFKLHHPENFIAGGGFFTHASLLPISLAWEAFGEKNGAASFEEVRERITRHRRSTDPYEDFVIGCVILQGVFFLDRKDWVPPPDDFHRNIVQGKTYDAERDAGAEIWERVQAFLRVVEADRVSEVQGPVYGGPVPVRQRLGQGAFRVLVTDAYQRQCAITGERALPALEAVHIRPVSKGGVHRLDNGLLFRSDVHRLFDRGYVTVTPDYKFRASGKLKDDFNNGEEYLQLHGNPLWLPRNPEDRPSREFLEWHADTEFRR